MLVWKMLCSILLSTRGIFFTICTVTGIICLAFITVLITFNHIYFCRITIAPILNFTISAI